MTAMELTVEELVVERSGGVVHCDPKRRDRLDHRRGRGSV
jgi:hypothetical protein